MTDNMPAPTVRAYKGFNPDMTCRGFQYAEGETYETDRAELCESGFHACPLPLDTLRYYRLASSVFHEVEVAADAEFDGNKVASRTIKIGSRISLADMISVHIDLLWQRIGPKREKALEEAASGYMSTAATSGDRSTAATSGDRSTAATAGHGSTAIAEGEHSIALAGGAISRARGAATCWLVLTERDPAGTILGMRAVAVGSETDGITIAPDTYYTLRDGRVVTA